MAEDKEYVQRIDKHAIDAFLDMYAPWEDFATADDILGDASLRNSLGAWPRFDEMDPLPEYKERLIGHGFSFRLDPSTNAPATAVRYRNQQHFAQEVFAEHDD